MWAVTSILSGDTRYYNPAPDWSIFSILSSDWSLLPVPFPPRRAKWPQAYAQSVWLWCGIRGWLHGWGQSPGGGANGVQGGAMDHTPGTLIQSIIKIWTRTEEVSYHERSCFRISSTVTSLSVRSGFPFFRNQSYPPLAAPSWPYSYTRHDLNLWLVNPVNIISSDWSIYHQGENIGVSRRAAPYSRCELRCGEDPRNVWVSSPRGPGHNPKYRQGCSFLSSDPSQAGWYYDKRDL